MAILHDKGAYGKMMAEVTGQTIKKLGGEVVSVDYAPVGTMDFRPILTKIHKMKPDAIYSGNVVMEGGLIKAQMAKLGLRYLYAANSGLYPKKFFEIAGKDPLLYNEPGKPPRVCIAETPVAALGGKLPLAPCSVALYALTVE